MMISGGYRKAARQPHSAATQLLSHHISSMAPPVTVPRMPMAIPRSRRGHHWLIMLMAGDQHAALTKPAMNHGMAMVNAEVPKDVAQLNIVVNTAPSVSHSRSP